MGKLKAIIHAVIGSFSCLVLSSAMAQTASIVPPLPIEDALRINSISGVSPFSVSPDGQWIAYTVTNPQRRMLGARHFSTLSARGVHFKVNGARAWIVNTKTRQQLALGDSASSAWGPVFSPDGREIAFYSDAMGKAQLWLYDVQTGTARRLSSIQVRQVLAYVPIVWSRDGNFIYAAIVSPEAESAKDASQPPGDQAVRVYRSPTTEGSTDPFGIIKADRLKVLFQARLAQLSVATGAVKPLSPMLPFWGWWLSPDGSHLAYTVATDNTDGTGDNMLYTLGVIDLATGESHDVGTRLPLVSYGVTVSWSPKGDRLAFATGGYHPITQDQSTNDCFVVDKAGMGIPVSIASVVHPRQPNYLRAPVWDADGRHIVLVDADALYIYDLAAHTAKTIAAGAGKSFLEVLASFDTHQLWARTSNELFAVRRDIVTENIEFVRVDITSDSIAVISSESRVITGTSTTVHLAATRDGGVLSYAAESAEAPEEIWVASPGFTRHEPVTHLNPTLVKYRFGKSQLITWNNSDGTILHGALLLPSDYKVGRTYPLIVDVYGGITMSRDVNRFGLDDGTEPTNAQIFATRGYAVLEPDMPQATVSPVLDLLKDVIPAVDKVVSMGIADPERVGIMGGSYGGYSVMSLITQSSRFKAAASIAGVYDLMQQYTWMEDDGVSRWIAWAEGSQGLMAASPWQNRDKYIENSPIWFADRITTPVLIACGTVDEPSSHQCRSMFTSLRRLGRTAEYREYPGGGHLPGSWNAQQQTDFVNALLGWFDQRLKGTVPACGRYDVPVGAAEVTANPKLNGQACLDRNP